MYNKEIAVLLVLFFAIVNLAKAQESPISSLSLDECIQRAFKNNPGYNAAEYQVRESQTQTKEAKSTWYPTVNINMDARKYPSEESGMPSESYNAGINARYTIFDGFGRKNKVDAAQSLYQAEEQRFQYTRDDLMYQVSKAYYRLWQAIEMVKVAEKFLDRARLYLEYAQTQFSAGIATRSDILKAQVEVSNARLTLAKVRNEKETAAGSLNVLMGNTAYEKISIEDAPKQIPFESTSETEIMNHYADRLTALALQNRPDLKMVEQQIQAQEANLGVARSGYLPTLSMETNYYSYGTSVSNMEISSSSFVGLNLSVPIFSGFKQTSKVERESLTLRRLKQELQQAHDLIGEEVWKAYLTVNEARERIDNTELLYENAEENLRIAEGEYQEGIGSMLDLIDAQTALEDADERRIEALRDYYTALANLRKVTGIDNIEEVLE